MAKYTNDLRRKVISLREKGYSLGQLHSEFRIPKTTIHSWVKNIEVDFSLKEKIRLEALNALQSGRVVYQQRNKLKRDELSLSLNKSGIKKIGILSEKELFIAGIALYWGEGFKNIHERRLGFCNSDPAMIKFYLHWLTKCLSIKTEDLVARVTVNAIYKKRIRTIEEYWSEITGIPLHQFSQPFYQNTKWKKQYNQENYNGVLRIHVKNSLESFLEMKGWIEGLKQNLPG